MSGGPWVRVEDDNPVPCKHYWVFTENPACPAAVGYTDEDGTWFSALDYAPLGKVTHFAEINPPVEPGSGNQ